MQKSGSNIESRFHSFDSANQEFFFQANCHNSYEQTQTEPGKRERGKISAKIFLGIIMF